jgi:haloacetate dehalogenase
MRAGRLEGFDYSSRRVGDCDYMLAEIGAGPVVLLLHGFPETHICWEAVGRELAASHRVLLCDLRGYGGSRAPAGGPRGEGFSKREMALELVELMQALGHHEFAVVGHDRGARVAYRLALDHGERVTRLALLNILPTIEQFERMGAGPSLGFWPWFLLAQPAPFPERVVAADPGAVLDHAFATWASNPEAITPERRAAYREALTSSTIAAICADYRASFHLDRQHDADDRASGRRISSPLLLMIGADETQLAEAPDIWRTWAHNVTVGRVPGGHFSPEEAPREVAEAIIAFLGNGAGR